MAESGSHLGLTSDLSQQSPSLGPSGRPSADDTRSEDELLSRNVAEDNPARKLGDSVPHAPPRVQEVPAENPTHASNRQLG